MTRAGELPPPDNGILAELGRLEDAIDRFGKLQAFAIRLGKQNVVENVGHAIGKLYEVREALSVSLSPAGLDHAKRTGLTRL